MKVAAAGCDLVLCQAITCDGPVISYEPKRRYLHKAQVSPGPPDPDRILDATEHSLAY